MTEAANSGHLFERPHLVKIDVERQSMDYACIKILEESEVLILRFDRLEVWRLDDHTIRLRVAYRGWLRARWKEALNFGFWHVIVALFVVALIFLAALMPESLAAWPFHISGDGKGSGDEPRPKLRALGKRLKEIASAA